jgi:hypothetical protein
LTNGIASNLKASAPQRKPLPESRDNPQNGRKVFASYSSNKRLIFRIYKKVKKINTKRTNNPIKNGQMNWTVLKRSTNG